LRSRHGRLPLRALGRAVDDKYPSRGAIEVEETLRSIAFTFVRFTSFAANAIVFGLVPVLLLVIRPAVTPLSEGDWAEGRTRLMVRFAGLVRAALIASAVATAIGLVLQVVLLSSLQGGEISGSAVAAVADTSFGRWYLIRLPLLGALAVLLLGRVQQWSLAGLGDTRGGPTKFWWVAWAGLGLALLSTSTFSGHAAVASPRTVAVVNDLIHLASVATWFTGIIVLAVALPDGWIGRAPADRLLLLAPSVLRFSHVAFVSITVAAITGTIHSFLNVGALGDMLSTGYGRVLTVKIGVFLLILTIGGINHLYLRQQMIEALEARRPTKAQPLFRKTIAAELAIGLAIMGITGILTGQARTRQDAASGGTAVSSESRP
jgi:copper transport protein